MKNDVFDCELTKEERLLGQAIKWAAVSDKEMAETFNKAVSPLLI